MIIDIHLFWFIIYHEVKTMELYEEIILNVLRSQKTIIDVSFPGLTLSAKEIVESASYGALLQIQHILKDESLNDQECFYKIEEIVRVFERLGSGCGGRHDFG